VGYPSEIIFKGLDKATILSKYAPEIFESDNFKKYGIEDVWIDYLYRNSIFECENIQYISNDGPGYIGVVIADVKSDDGYYVEDAEMSIEEVLQKIEKLKEVLDIQEKPKIYVGTRSC